MRKVFKSYANTISNESIKYDKKMGDEKLFFYYLNLKWLGLK